MQAMRSRASCHHAHTRTQSPMVWILLSPCLSLHKKGKVIANNSQLQKLHSLKIFINFVP